MLGRNPPVKINCGRGGDEYKKLRLTKRRKRRGPFIANPRNLAGFALTVRERLAVRLRRWR